MKEKLFDNIGLKGLSLLIAFFVWLVIVNIEDPVETKTFTALDVKVQNESIITNDGKMYQMINNTNYVDVTVSAQRSILRRINKSDIVVSADILNLQMGSVVPLTVSIPAYEGKYKSAETFPKNIQIEIEDIETIKLPISAELTGTLRDGYFIEYTTVSPDYVTVSGPESIIRTIDSATVTGSASGLSEDAQIKGILHFYDADKQLVDETALTTNIGDAGVYITAHVMEMVEMPISVKTIGTPKDSYVLTSVSCEPAKISLTGKEELFDKLSEIVISDLSISGADSTIETVVDISDYLPEGISTADKDSVKVLVTAVIEKAGTKTINYPVGSIVVNNAPAGYTVTYPGLTELQLVFQGAEANLDMLKQSDIKVEVDLMSMKSANVFDVNVEVEVPEGVRLMSSRKIRVKLEKE